MKLRLPRLVLRKPLFFSLMATLIALVIIPLAALTSVASASRVNLQFVPPEWVANNLRDPNLRILDVRTNPLAYIAGHVPGAVNIADPNFRGPNGFLPVQFWDVAKLQDTFTKSGVTDKSKVLVYSEGNEVLGATQVAYLLERASLPNNIYVLDGGYAGYKAAGQPITKEFPRYKSGRFTYRDNSAIRITLDEVAKLIGKPGVVFIDPRPSELFRGEKDIWVRNGHIPGAKNIPWPTFTEAANPQESLQNPHKLKPLDDLRKILADKNIKPSDTIVVTCSTGREASLQFLVLKHLLGYPNVRLYEGSWTEYSTSNLPVETGPEKTI